MDRGLRSNIDDALRRLADGDRAAFDLLFAELWPLLQRFCTRLMAAEDEAADAAQQALLKVYWRVSEYDRRRDGLTWIFAIAANECRTLRRKRQRRREELWSPDVLARMAPADLSQDREIHERDLIAALEATLDSLQPLDVQTLRMALGWAEKPAALPAPTFRKRLERALRRVRQAWGVMHDAL